MVKTLLEDKPKPEIKRGVTHHKWNVAAALERVSNKTHLLFRGSFSMLLLLTLGRRGGDGRRSLVCLVKMNVTTLRGIFSTSKQGFRVGRRNKNCPDSNFTLLLCNLYI